MKVPKFLLADNSQNNPEDIFVIHTEFPRFIINLKNDEIEIWEEISNEEKKELSENMAMYIEQASKFYDREMSHYEAE